MQDMSISGQKPLLSGRPHIGIFGRRNSGKSSLINCLAGQDVAIVSEHAGTTTDPVRKVMEITGIGPVVLIDTAGIDDIGDLGKLRVDRTTDVLRQVDLAIIVISHNTFGDRELRLMENLETKNTPFFVVHSKSDLVDLADDTKALIARRGGTDCLSFSAADRRNLDALVDLIKKHIPASGFNNPTILGGMVGPNDIVLLITPIDVETPAGRLILPQVQTIRNLLDNNCVAIVMKETELDAFLKQNAIKPKLAITDSQAFMHASASIPRDVPLTSFSILFARLKGDFKKYAEGTPAISGLKDGDRILIMESCSHHVAGDDIGRIKIPRWMRQFTGKDLHFDITAGLDNPPLAITSYRMIIQCGGCMLTRKQVMNRLKPAIDAGIPVSNYGMTIAYCLGIFDRAMEPFASPLTESKEAD